MSDEPVAEGEETVEAPLLELSDGLPPVVETPEALAETIAALAEGTGPVAIDAERASGYRYSPRAYLVQLRRAGAGTALIDPIPFGDLSDLGKALGDAEWVVHAASQDLACLAELGLRPPSLFDTELAGRLLGYPRVGLGTLVETVLGKSMRKEHSAVDWSTRPLPEPWLEYAALDVEALLQLRDVLAAELEDAGKTAWALEEFEHVALAGPPGPRQDPWRRTSGMHRARGRRAMAAVRELWAARDELAERRDVTPGRIIPDSAIIEAANAMPGDTRALIELKGFHGRGAHRYIQVWVSALRRVRQMPDAELPPFAQRYDGPPPPRAWPDRNEPAARRLSRSREALRVIAYEHTLPVENLLTPDTLRRVMWEPPAATDGFLEEALASRLRELGAREWQIGLTLAPLAEAIEAE